MNETGVKTAMKTDAVEKIVQYGKGLLDIQDSSTPPEYQSLSVCLIESVYSLRAKYYSVVLPIVEQYADKYLCRDKYAADDSLEDFMPHVSQAGGCECFADTILMNRQKLSGRNKTGICYEIADKLSRLLEINTLEDFQSYDTPELLDIVLRSVNGFGDAGIFMNTKAKATSHKKKVKSKNAKETYKHNKKRAEFVEMNRIKWYSIDPYRDWNKFYYKL